MSFRSLNILPPALFITAALAIATTSCGSEHREERVIDDSKHFPTMLTTDVSTFISDSGYTRYHVEAPLWIMYEEADTPFWTFPQGIDMQKFDDSMAINATFRADSATYFSVLKTWRFDGNVNMRNTDGDRFATPQLFWDQNSKRVYSDSFMHIERDERIIEGYGFESNDQMTEYTILHPQMILPIDRMRKERADREAQDSLQALQADSVPASGTASTETENPVRPVPGNENKTRRLDREQKLQSTAESQIKKELK
ncbi:MAG: LPS export ABC transporter periplasmic protein LptC [Muribaculaceae bacterium]|nr:LPS export ABC transporter periplasmic protein LptC [Muribaculaceae bacterium]